MSINSQHTDSDEASDTASDVSDTSTDNEVFFDAFPTLSGDAQSPPSENSLTLLSTCLKALAPRLKKLKNCLTIKRIGFLGTLTGAAFTAIIGIVAVMSLIAQYKSNRFAQEANEIADTSNKYAFDSLKLQRVKDCYSYPLMRNTSVCLNIRNLHFEELLSDDKKSLLERHIEQHLNGYHPDDRRTPTIRILFKLLDMSSFALPSVLKSWPELVEFFAEIFVTIACLCICQVICQREFPSPYRKGESWPPKHHIELLAGFIFCSIYLPLLLTSLHYLFSSNTWTWDHILRSPVYLLSLTGIIQDNLLERRMAHQKRHSDEESLKIGDIYIADHTIPGTDKNRVEYSRKGFLAGITDSS